MRTLLVDLDGIVADFFGLLFERYEEQTGEKVHINQIKEWDMGKYVSHPDVLKDVFHTPGFFAALKPIPGALEALADLKSDGNHIVIATTPCTSHSVMEKWDWCHKHLSGIVPTGDIFIGANKWRIRADYMIDDGAHNAVDFQKYHPHAQVLTIHYPYNDHPVYSARYGGHIHESDERYRRAWKDIVAHIRAN